MYFKTSQEHEDFRAKVRAFAEKEVKPIAFLLDKENRFPEEAVKKWERWVSWDSLIQRNTAARDWM